MLDVHEAWITPGERLVLVGAEQLTAPQQL